MKRKEVAESELGQIQETTSKLRTEENEHLERIEELKKSEEETRAEIERLNQEKALLNEEVEILHGNPKTRITKNINKLRRNEERREELHKIGTEMYSMLEQQLLTIQKLMNELDQKKATEEDNVEEDEYSEEGEYSKEDFNDKIQKEIENLNEFSKNEQEHEERNERENEEEESSDYSNCSKLERNVETEQESESQLLMHMLDNLSVESVE